MSSGPIILRQLRAALETAADALAAARPDPLSATERELATIVERLPLVLEASADADGREALQAEAAAVDAALRRCRRLGGALGDVVRAVLLAEGRTGIYDRDGVESIAVAGSGFDARG
jgi:hypothetical protein